jgi:hypothetical protein
MSAGRSKVAQFQNIQSHRYCLLSKKSKQLPGKIGRGKLHQAKAWRQDSNLRPPLISGALPTEVSAPCATGS